MDELIKLIVTQAPNFIGLVVALVYLWRDGQRKQSTIEHLINVIVKRENCPEDLSPIPPN